MSDTQSNDSFNQDVPRECGPWVRSQHPQSAFYDLLGALADEYQKVLKYNTTLKVDIQRLSGSQSHVVCSASASKEVLPIPCVSEGYASDSGISENKAEKLSLLKPPVSVYGNVGAVESNGRESFEVLAADTAQSSDVHLDLELDVISGAPSIDECATISQSPTRRNQKKSKRHSITASSRVTRHSLATRSLHSGIFPDWYDPEFARVPLAGKKGEDHVDYVASVLDADGEDHVMSLAASPDGEWHVYRSNPNEIQRSRCVMSPIGTTRLSWDMMAVLCLLFELWATPFSLIFKDDEQGGALLVVNFFVTSFFLVDIILNFYTAYIIRDRMVWDRRHIVRTYLRGWFFLDFVATVPWDLVLETMSGGGFLSTIRLAKIAKAFKTLKFLKLVRAARACREMNNTATYSNIPGFAMLAIPVQISLAALIVSHFNGSAWAFLQPDWEPSESWKDAFRMYFKSLWWAFMMLAAGTVSGYVETDQQPWLWAMDVVIASERVCFAAALCYIALFSFMSNHAEEAAVAKVKSDATKYLRARNVDVRVQMQVLYSLKEAGQAQIMQRRFKKLMAGALPLELQRELYEALWSAPLMSLGLIMHVAHWHDDIVRELSLVAQEEVLASKTIVFEEQNAAIAAYYIIRGTLAVISSLVASTRPIPDFEQGMWLGEKALVNPLLRRSGTAICKTTSNLMNLSGESFHSILATYGLSEKFREFCNEFLWRGLCGRCGVLGDHFTHACPLTVLNEYRLSTSRSASKPTRLMTSLFSRTSQMLGYPPRRRDVSGHLFPNSSHLDKKLKQFLSQQRLEWLEPSFKQLAILTVEDLQEFDINRLEEHLIGSSHPTGASDAIRVLSVEDRQALSSEAIAQFSQVLVRQTGKMLSPSVSRAQHFVFLSHFKQEAGAEAALIRHELEQMINKDSRSPAHQFTTPVFLDSEDLTNLSMLQHRVRQSHNIALLLTENVFTRPWVLIELVTAQEAGACVLPILLVRGVHEFKFPDEEFFQSVKSMTSMDEDAWKLLQSCGIEPSQVETSVRATLRRIAVPYSPHRPESIRRSELQALLKQCRLKRTYMPDMLTPRFA